MEIGSIGLWRKERVGIVCPRFTLPQRPHLSPQVRLLWRQVEPATDLNRTVTLAGPHDGRDVDHLHWGERQH